MQLDLGWWNVGNFAHYDPARHAERRWPQSPEAYDDKLACVAEVLREAMVNAERPIVLALGEVTARAAEALRDAVLPGYRVESLDLRERSELEVAFIYPDDDAFTPLTPFTVAHVPRGTRSMAVLEYAYGDHRIRFVACHWTARFDPSSDIVRSEIARQFGRYIFQFFAESLPDLSHVIVMGDLNEEPFGIVERELHAHRHRGRAAQSQHWRDKDVNRKHLYNLAWRFTGEQRPFTAPMDDTPDIAGTYFYDGDWYTFDHLIVDGSLVTGSAPVVDEASARVVHHPKLFNARGVPQMFAWKGPGSFSGISDHLPITGTLHLEDV